MVQDLLGSGEGLVGVQECGDVSDVSTWVSIVPSMSVCIVQVSSRDLWTLFHTGGQEEHIISSITMRH